MSSPREILEFWLSDRARPLWFEKDSVFDADIRARFGPLVHQAQLGGFEEWRTSPDGALALLLLLDQFARNIFRGQAKAFLGDPRARAVAAEAVARGFDRRYPFPDRVFFYLPFEHGETLANQDRFIALLEAACANSAMWRRSSWNTATATARSSSASAASRIATRRSAARRRRKRRSS